MPPRLTTPILSFLARTQGSLLTVYCHCSSMFRPYHQFNYVASTATCDNYTTKEFSESRSCFFHLLNRCPS